MCRSLAVSSWLPELSMKVPGRLSHSSPRQKVDVDAQLTVRACQSGLMRPADCSILLSAGTAVVDLYPTASDARVVSRGPGSRCPPRLPAVRRDLSAPLPHLLTFQSGLTLGMRHRIRPPQLPREGKYLDGNLHHPRGRAPHESHAFAQISQDLHIFADPSGRNA